MDFLVQDVLSLAMGKCGATRINELPRPYELTTGLMLANMMLGAWSAERCMIRSTSQDHLTLTAGKSAYTVGPSASYDLNTSKPLTIIGAFIRDQYSIDLPVDIVTRDTFDAYEDKQFAQARPISLYYDPGSTQQSTLALPSGYGTINLYYIPDASLTYTLYFDSDKYLTDFVNLTDQINMEPVYYEALVDGLALRMFRHFHGPEVPIPLDMEDAAAASKRRVMTLNNKPVIARIDVPGRAVGQYNIYTGLQNNT